MTKTTIYIATHKLFTPPKDKNYTPITAGAFYHNLPYLKDNTKDNISEKNPYYSELTALYWIWKNDPSDIIGFTHYHRYFQKWRKIQAKESERILKKSDIIIPTPLELSCSVYEQYASVHYPIDLQLAMEEIIRKYPDYKQTIYQVLNQKKLYTCNMFITTREILEDYLNFLFPILFTLEEKIPYLNYSIYNQRVFGFLAERIFNIYLNHKKWKTQEYPVVEKMPLTEQVKKREKIQKDIEKDNQNERKNEHI